MKTAKISKNHSIQTSAIQAEIELRGVSDEQRVKAAESLLSLAKTDPELAAPLVRMALETREKLVCRAACKALPEIALALPEAGNELFRSLFNEEIGDTKSLEPVTELKELSRRSPQIAAEILKTLIRIPEHYANAYSSLALTVLAETDPKIALPLIEEALASEDVSVRIQGAQALEAVAAGMPELAAPLINEAFQNKDDMVLNATRRADRMMKRVQQQRLAPMSA